LAALFAGSPGYILTADNLSCDFPDEGIIILNSLPKAGRYTDSDGEEFSYGITRTTLMNVSGNSLQLTIHFPADSFAFVASPGSYVKLFLTPDSISFNGIPFNNSSWYISDGLTPFLDAGLYAPTARQEIISAKQERIFYIASLYHKTAGVPTAELVLKEQNLFFRPARLDSLLIPCGKISYKK
jgi:hypothetical protein